MPAIEFAKAVIKKEGLSSFLKKAFKHYVFSLLYLPACFLNLKRAKFKTLEDYAHFVFWGNHKYFEPMQVRSEILSLLKYVGQTSPKTIMEIGTARGGTLFLLARMAPKDAFIISLDLPGGMFGGGYPFWRSPLYKSFARDKQSIKLVRDDSHNERVFERVKGILGDRKIDFLFIDGDHTYKGVKRDFELYSRLVRKGGMIAFHDIVSHPKDSKCEVNRFWGVVKRNRKYKEFIEDKNQKWAGIGLIEV